MEENRSAAGQLRSVEVYFDDLDAFGMVHNAKYAVLQERAWQRLWMEYGHDIRSPDGLQVTRVLSVDYHLPIVAAERATVVLWVNRVGRTERRLRLRRPVRRRPDTARGGSEGDHPHRPRHAAAGAVDGRGPTDSSRAHPAGG